MIKPGLFVAVTVTIFSISGLSPATGNYETDEAGALLAKFAQSRTDIASVDLQTGLRTLQTASNETKLSPMWLPGGRISYVNRARGKAEGLSIWNPNLRVDRVIRGPVRNPSWSPDHQSVVYERMSRLGSSQHFVPTFSRDPDFALTLVEPFLSFSRDGREALYSQVGTGTSATGLVNSNLGDTSIEIMDGDGTHKRTLFHRAGFSAFSAAFAPNGDEVALSVGRYFRAPGTPPAQIALIKPDGSNFRLIVDDAMNNGFPSWSPDGADITFKRGRQVVVMSLADRHIVSLTDDAHWNNFPQWSPTDDRILFMSDRDGRFELYTVRRDGTDRRRLTHVAGDNAHASWCSDGQWIVFTSGRMGFKDEMAQYEGVPQPYGELFAMRADGSDVRQLTDNKWEDASAACISGTAAR
jgi:Tol biopolymer transport system component